MSPSHLPTNPLTLVVSHCRTKNVSNWLSMKAITAIHERCFCCPWDMCILTLEISEWLDNRWCDCLDMTFNVISFLRCCGQFHILLWLPVSWDHNCVRVELINISVESNSKSGTAWVIAKQAKPITYDKMLVMAFVDWMSKRNIEIVGCLIVVLAFKSNHSSLE